MIPRDVIGLTLKNIKYRKQRSALTILGIIIGIAAVVGLMGLGDAIEGAITTQLSGLGGDKLIITPGVSQQAFSRSANFDDSAPSTTITSDTTGAKPLTEREAQEISSLPYILAVSPMVQKSFNVQFRSEYSRVTVQFIEPIGANLVEQPNMLEGRWLTPSDKNTCVLGYTIAKDTYSNDINLGDVININGTTCRVGGILTKQGGLTGMDNYIALNINAIKTYIPDYNDELSYINVRVSDTEKVTEVEESITRLLLRLHNTIEKDFTLLSFATIQESVSAITTLITAFLGGIAAISLLVGAIGISNTMFTSVMERTREIGILKAIGAKEKDILALFIAEASIMSLIGGLIGLLMGIGLSWSIINILPLLFPLPSGGANLKLVINPILLIGALMISIIIGAISGYFPARKAAKLNPIEAIWYE